MTVAIAEPTTVTALPLDRGSRRASRLRILNAASETSATERSTAAAATIATERGGELFVVHVTHPAEVRVIRLGPMVIRTRRLDDPYCSPVLLRARRLAWGHGALLARVVLMDGDPGIGDTGISTRSASRSDRDRLSILHPSGRSVRADAIPTATGGIDPSACRSTATFRACRGDPRGRRGAGEVS